MTHAEIVEALESLGVEGWVVRGEEIEWFDEPAHIPTIDDLKAESERIAYRKARRNAYPSVEDQLDLLYHGGFDGWFEAIDAVKKQFPKP